MMRSDIFAAARRRIQQEMVNSGIPSVAVAVARNGEILWEEAFGLADRAKMLPATEHTLYSLASVSKPMTATAIMKLVEQGKLDLDQPVNTYLSETSRLKVWIGDEKEVTIRRVANHTAGLPAHLNFYLAEELSRKPAMEESIRRYGNIVTLPGERYRYSNMGYGILDHLIERLSGLSYAEFMRREIFLPLGMNRSSVDIGPGLADFTAARYDENGLFIPFYDCDHRGASAVYSSAHDLLRFGMWHLRQCQPDQKAVLSDGRIAAMQVPTAVMDKVNPADKNLRPGSKYGVGWVIDDDELDYRISHGGGMMGASAKLLMLPKEGIVVVAMANISCPLPYTIERDILGALLPAYVDTLSIYEENKWAVTDSHKNAVLQKIPELLGNWQGQVHTYQGDFPLELSFKASGDVHARLGDQLTTLVNDADFSEGCLTGKISGYLGTEDTNRRPRHPYHHLQLDLKLRGKVLNGALIATAGCALGHWMELKRALCRTGLRGSQRKDGRCPSRRRTEIGNECVAKKRGRCANRRAASHSSFDSRGE